MRHALLKLTVGSVLILLSAGVTAQAGMITIFTTPNLDGNVGSRNRNGILDTLSLTGGGAFFNGAFDLSRVVLEFDLSAIPTGSTINTATLRVVANAGGSRSTGMVVHSFIGNGVLEVGDATPLGAVVGSVSGIVPRGAAPSFSVDPAFVQQARNLSGFAGFQLRDLGGSSVSLFIQTSDFVVDNFKPQLTIDFDPASSLPLILTNGDFQDGLNGWTVAGEGTATATDFPAGSGNLVAELTAGSQVILSQDGDTPGSPFSLDYEYRLTSLNGVLEVLLDGMIVDTLAAINFGPMSSFDSRSVFIDDPTKQGLTGVPLEFRWNGPTGAIVQLDNISISPVPEPGSVVLFAMGALGLVGYGWRRKRKQGSCQFSIAVSRFAGFC